MLSGAVLLGVGTLSAAVAEVVWPTPNQAFMQGGDWAAVVQPTVAGTTESALFGCVRNNGRRFHAGLDIAPVGRDRRNEATDAIYAAMEGRVRYINRQAGNSSFGIYVVLEHETADIPVYTLYAHLARVDADLRVGQQVMAGSRLGTMGRTAGGYTIPRNRAHLHFEIGLRKSDRFDAWFASRDFGSPNHHGNFNGMNLVALDPVQFYETVRAGEFHGFIDYFDRVLKPAFRVRVGTDRIPDMILRYPKLSTRPVPAGGVVAWDIDFTWYGLPIRWTPRTAAEIGPQRSGSLVLLAANQDAFKGNCRQTVLFSADGTARMGDRLEGDIRQIFGFY